MADNKKTAVAQAAPLEQCLELLPEKLGYTKEQKRKLRFYKIAIPIGVVIVLVLGILRWFLGGWWLDWVDEKRPLPGAPAATETQPEPQVTMGDFVAPPHDEAAVTGTPAVPEELGWANLSVQQGYTVHVCGILNANEDGTLPVWFASDAGNTVWVKLRILAADGTRLGETGILYPGEYVELVQLNAAAASGEVKLQVLGYEPDTYYSAGSVGLTTALNLPD